MKTQQQITVSEVRLVYRTKIKASERLQVKCSKDAFDIFIGSWELDSIEHFEEFKLMLLTRSNKVLGIASIIERWNKWYCNRCKDYTTICNQSKCQWYHNMPQSPKW